MKCWLRYYWSWSYSNTNGQLHMHSPQAVVLQPQRQRQGELHEFQANLLYIGIPRTTRTTSTLPQKQKQKQTKKMQKKKKNPNQTKTEMADIVDFSFWPISPFYLVQFSVCTCVCLNTIRWLLRGMFLKCLFQFDGVGQSEFISDNKPTTEEPDLLCGSQGLNSGQPGLQVTLCIQLALCHFQNDL